MTGRYARQEALPGVGAEGQARIGAARVLVIGCGGLGCPVIQTLAGAGVGSGGGALVLVDPDVVELHNLHRQTLYSMFDVGRPKALCAAERVLALNPEVAVAAHVQTLDPATAPDLMAGIDLVIDAADSHAVTYTLSDLCRARGLPLIAASALRFGGYVGGFCGGGASYRAVFPDAPAAAESCATAGVLGPTVATLGAIQAQMALAVILGLAPSPLGRLVTVDLAALRFGTVDFASAPEPERIFPFVAAAGLVPGDCIVELRPVAEAPQPAVPGALRLLPEELAGWTPPEGRIVLCCHSGLRAWRAAEALAARGRTDLALLAAGDG